MSDTRKSPGWRTDRQPAAESMERKPMTLRLLLQRPLYRAIAIAIGLALVPVIAPFIGLAIFLFSCISPFAFLILLMLGWSFVPTEPPRR